jgi:hypothetical protein
MRWTPSRCAPRTRGLIASAASGISGWTLWAPRWPEGSGSGHGPGPGRGNQLTARDQQIRATRREVQTGAVDGRQAHVVRLTRAYETSVEDLWSACTDAERIPRWLLPISGELRLGGPLSAGGQRRRDDYALRAARASSRQLGVRRLGKAPRPPRRAPEARRRRRPLPRTPVALGRRGPRRDNRAEGAGAGRWRTRLD